MSIEDNKDNILFSWTVLPARKNVLKTVLFLLIFAVVTALIHFAFQTPLFTILSALILGGSFVQYFLPTTYEILEDRIRVKRLFNTAEKELKYYRRVIVDKHGVFLSPSRLYTNAGCLSNSCFTSSKSPVFTALCIS